MIRLSKNCRSDLERSGKHYCFVYVRSSQAGRLRGFPSPLQATFGIVVPWKRNNHFLPNYSEQFKHYTLITNAVEKGLLNTPRNQSHTIIRRGIKTTKFSLSKYEAEMWGRTHCSVLTANEFHLPISFATQKFVCVSYFSLPSHHGHRRLKPPLECLPRDNPVA